MPSASWRKRHPDWRPTPVVRPVDGCSACGERQRIVHKGSGRCYYCYVDGRALAELAALEKAFLDGKTAASRYNETLFTLFLTYLRRHHVFPAHVRQAKRFAELLAEVEIPTIRSWLDVSRLQELYPFLYYRSKSKNSGCPFGKAARILQELDVISAPSEEFGRRLERVLSSIEPATREILRDYVEGMRRSRRVDATIDKQLRNLRAFHGFLTEELCPPTLILLADRATLETYLERLRDHLSATSAYMMLSSIRGFYRWAKLERRILIDPSAGIEMGSPKMRCVVLPKEDFARLFAWIKDGKADPELRLVVTLILFFGFTLASVATSTVEFDAETGLIRGIKLRRKPPSKGRFRLNRDEVFRLNQERIPAWLTRLQKAYYARWLARLRENGPKAGLGAPPLILSRGKQGGTRVVPPLGIAYRLAEATRAALGEPVPESVLRQTCGHILSRQQDASLLSRMGWSSCAAFRYTWMPRTYSRKRSASNCGLKRRLKSLG